MCLENKVSQWFFNNDHYVKKIVLILSTSLEHQCQIAQAESFILLKFQQCSEKRDLVIHLCVHFINSLTYQSAKSTFQISALYLLG